MNINGKEMKTIKCFAVLSLLAGLSGCNSKPDLDGFREVEISNNILDTIPENRLNNYKETIECKSSFRT